MHIYTYISTFNINYIKKYGIPTLIIHKNIKFYNLFEVILCNKSQMPRC